MKSNRGMRFAITTAFVLLSSASCTTGSTPVDPTASSPSTSSLIPSARQTVTKDELDTAVKDFLHNGDPLDKVRSVLVWSDGQLLLERYSGGTAEQTRNVWGATASVMSTLIGIAVAENKLRLDDTLATMLPEYSPFMRFEFAAVTLRQLLTMTSGLPGNANSGLSFMASDDWVQAIAKSGNVRPAGEFAYSDPGPHLLSAILAKATGQSVLDYARVKLFDPLGIQTSPAYEPTFDETVAAGTVKATIDAYENAGFSWPTDPQGHHLGSFGLKLTPRDLLKIGQLYLDQGKWNGAQVVPTAWVADATSTHATTVDVIMNGGYGYLWWNVRAAGEPAFAAVGIGGQLVEVVPGRRLVVVVTSEFRLDEDGWTGLDTRVLIDMVDKVIAPKV